MNLVNFEPLLPRSDALSTRQAAALVTSKSYYRTVFALVRGDAHRPALPFELVVYIIQYAELVSPCPSKSLSDYFTYRPSPRPKAPFDIRRHVQLLKTSPFTANNLRTIRSIEAVVNFVNYSRYKVSKLHARGPHGITLLCAHAYTGGKKMEQDYLRHITKS